MNNKNTENETSSKKKRTYNIGINAKPNIEKEKTLIEKILSFLGNMYYHISKIIILTVIATTIGILVTNYNVFPVIEKIFIKDEHAERSKETLLKIEGLNLNTEMVSEEEFKEIKNKIDSEISTVILEQNLFKEGRVAFNNKMRVFYSQEYSEKINIEDKLYNALSNIYDFDYRYPYFISLTSIGKIMYNNKPLTKAVVDINAVDDDKGFHVTSIALMFNSKYEIEDIDVVFESKDYEQTRTPLDLEYSLISNSINNIMLREVNRFKKDFNNKALYDKMQLSALDINNSQLKSFLSNLKIEQKDYDVLSDLFKLIKGSSNNFSIIEYLQTDFDTQPITSIIIGVKTTEKIYKYNLTFDRNKEKLITISEM